MRTKPTHRCPGCGTRHYLPILSNPRWCYHCALWLTPWTLAPFGRVRKLPRVIAARWG